MQTKRIIQQVYVTSVRDGTPSTIKNYDEIRQNFFIANYNSNEGVDNDDGSCFYKTHDNFFVYGLRDSLKNDVGGHNNIQYNNIIGYVNGDCFGICQQLPGFNDGFYNNTCIINSNKTKNYGSFSCGSSKEAWPMLGDNKIYALGSDLSNVGLCGMNEKEFQSKYNMDKGTVILGEPDNEKIIQQAKQLLYQ